MRHFHASMFVAVLTSLSLAGAPRTGLAKPIEAIKGKHYGLTKDHGPWMIMVASFRNVPEDRRQPGLSAEDAANELIYELRQKGIPAYIHEQDARVSKIDTVDRLGRPDERVFAAQRDMVCVLAGNYKSSEDPIAQQTREYVKKFQPKFMKDDKAGGLYRQTPGRQGPLAGAFLTVNPLLSPEEVARQNVDTEAVKFNYGARYSLTENKHRYTLRVATFAGKSAIPFGSSRFRGREEDFDKNIHDASQVGVNNAGEDATQLAGALRQKKIDAYVYHGHYDSIVTIGGFDDPNDPEITKLAKQYGAKPKVDPLTQQQKSEPEYLVLPNPRGNGVPLTWVFDLQPAIMEVPKLKRGK